MPYDPKWEIKTDPLSLENFIAWLETKNPDETYNFFDAVECLVGQWIKSIDQLAGPVEGQSSEWYFVQGGIVDLSKFVALANTADTFTFGGALHRARQAVEFAQQ